MNRTESSRRDCPSSAATRFAAWSINIVLAMGMQAWAADATQPGWRPHHIRYGDGEGKWKLKQVQCQILHSAKKGWTCGFGIIQMDNGEVALLGTVNPGKSLWYGGGGGGADDHRVQPRPRCDVVAVSRDLEAVEKRKRSPADAAGVSRKGAAHVQKRLDEGPALLQQ